MLDLLRNLFGQANDYLAGKPTEGRSPKWPAKRASHLIEDPRCNVCGTTQNLNVHHKKPYHLYPALELVDSNLITLCEENGCHFLYGHGRDWKAYNPHVDTDVVIGRDMISGRVYK